MLGLAPLAAAPIAATAGAPRPIAESVAPISLVTGALGRSRGLTEAIAPASLLAASLRRSRALTVAIAPVSLQTATQIGLDPISAALTPTSVVSATLGRSRALAESTTPTSLQAASLHGIHALTESLSPTSALSATLGRTRSLTGASAPTSLQAVTLARSRALTEAAAPTSVQTAVLARSRALAEAATPTSLLTGVLHSGHPLTGAVAATSLQTAALARSRALTLAVAPISLQTAVQIGDDPISAALTPTSLVSVTLGRNRPLTGPAASVTQVTLAVLTTTAGFGLAYTTQAIISVLVVNGPYLNGAEIEMPATYPTLPGLSYSVIKRPKWFTGIGTSASGREVRVAYAVDPLWEWDLTYTYLPDEQTASSASASDLKLLLGFYNAQSGSFAGFLFRDPDDNAVTAQLVGTGDGVTTNFTMVRTYGGDDGTGTEPIGYVDLSQPVTVDLAGVLAASSSYQIATAIPVNQQIKFAAAPAAGVPITVSFSYFYFVRFKDSHYDFEKFMDKLWQTATITLMSQRG